MSRVKRLLRMACDGNLPGLWHQSKRALGLGGLVPAPSMPKPKRTAYFESGNCNHSFLGTSALSVQAFSHDLNLEGASRSLFELVSALQKKGAVNLQVIAFKDGPLRKQYEGARIKVDLFVLDSDKLSTVRRLDAQVRALAEIIRYESPDLVFANTLQSFLAILAAEKAGVPSVWNLRESAPWNKFFRYLPDSVAQRAISAISLPHRVVFVANASRQVWNIFERHGSFTVIHNGIDLSRFPEKGVAVKREREALGLGDDAVILLSVGTINARKCQGDLVEAVALLPWDILERVQVFLVGDDSDPYAKKLKRRCRRLPHEVYRRIKFFQSTESVQHFYEAADIFVLCSKEESFPRVILEAMAFGKPIISTAVHGVTEQCLEGENAIFYANGNTKDLAAKIASLVEDKVLRQRMARRSLEIFSGLITFEEMVDTYLSILRQAAMNNKTTSSTFMKSRLKDCYCKAAL